MTDYGTYDGYAAACHGVIARTAPTVRVIDITHDVPPGDIQRGAVVLSQAVRYMPRAVHVAVVDPGVGTSRRAIAMACPDGVLVGPDNGLLPWAAGSLGGADHVVELSDASFHGEQVAATFHGRDIFTPVAAHIAAGTPVASVGTSVDPATLVRLPSLRHEISAGEMRCAVLTADRFGNLTTTSTAGDVQSAGLRIGETLTVSTDHGEHTVRLARAFADAAYDELLSYVESYGYLALAVNGGNAASRLRLREGDDLVIRRVTAR